MVPFRYNLRSLAVRKTTTAATALGIALVVFVLAASMMLSNGVKKTLASSGRADTAIVMRKGSDTEMSSSIEDPQVGVILSAPGVKRGDDGKPLGVGEVVMVATLEKLGTAGGISNVGLRGVPENVFAFRTDARVIDGRSPRPGTDEVVVGKRLRGRFRGLEIGDSFELRKNRPVRVVGVFESGGSSFESEVWVDVDTMRAAFGREGQVSSVRVRLDSAGKLDVFRAAVEQDKNLGFEALRETEYYEKQSEGTSKFVFAMGTLIAVFFAIGAIIGAMITMYAAIAGRRREIGTLRALGFSRTSILVAFLGESIALALLGGGVGVAGALAMGAVKLSMMNFSTWSEITFRFEPTPEILVGSIVFAALMGIFGGLLPAVRAARTSPVQAMRG